MSEELEKFKEIMQFHIEQRKKRQRTDFADFIKERCNIEGYEALAKVAQNAIPAIKIAMDDSEIPIGASKKGGFPDLPPSISYPTMNEFSEEQKKWVQVRPGVYKTEPDGFITHPKSAMQLLGQFNLSESAPFDKDNLLPKTGMLYFFWSGELPCYTGQISPFKVIYWNGDISELRRTAPAIPYYDKYFTEPLPSAKLAFEYCKNEYDIERVQKELGEEYDYYPDYNIRNAKLFGYPTGVNIDIPRGDIINLYQSGYRSGCICDIYWYIRKQDLAALNFDNTIFVSDLD